MVSLAKTEPRERLLRVRCTATELTRWQLIADTRDETLSGMVRALLNGTPPRSRRFVPRADPRLIRQIACVGNNMNQIARAVNAAHVAGARAHAGDILSELAIIERQLGQLVDKVARSR